MRRLSTQIYFVIILSLMVMVVVSALFWRRGPDRGPMRQAFEVAGELASVSLAPKSAPPKEQQEAVTRLAERLNINISLFEADRRPIAAHGPLLPAPPEDREDSGWIYGRGGPAWAIELPDGRWLVARGRRRGPSHPVLSALAFLGAISLLVALSTWPVVRGLTRRLEKLQQAVDKVGSGDLKARVPVEGRDEVAKLAESFNRSTARIEELVGAHKMLLANASHELRTPLSRIRLGLELLDGGAAPARKAALEKDIAEVDQLIDEILLASRLDALEQLEALEEVDLLALAAEEGARYDECVVDGEPVLIRGDGRLLRRLVRNLIENAHRHGTPPVEVEVRPDRASRSLRLTVSDAGPGIPLAERARVFEPFRRGRASEPSTTRPDAVRGTGLGLTLVRQIARRHGGDARIEGPDGTSRIMVTLPLPIATN
ncbi:MAG: HAMP domain-containing sensor histidine kinase [Hyphomicrobium sp.]